MIWASHLNNLTISRLGLADAGPLLCITINPLNNKIMMYNKAELKAMLIIASKLNWHKPAYETVETITRMVHNQQAMELDCVGECDDFEETLLSMALWDADKIGSTLFINDYHSLIGYEHSLFLETMGITEEDYKAMQEYYDTVIDDAEYEKECEEYEQALYEEYS